MNMDVILIILAANITAALGQLILKVGMGQIGEVDGIYLEKVIQMFTNPIVLLGLASYAVSTVFWLTALSRKDLSYVYPFFAVTIILVMILSYFVLHEQIGIYRILGVIVIILGILVISRS
jgi:multidrug transporter EmrE-like cation transporter